MQGLQGTLVHTVLFDWNKIDVTGAQVFFKDLFYTQVQTIDLTGNLMNLNDIEELRTNFPEIKIIFRT